jgi:hypothetical protein
MINKILYTVDFTPPEPKELKNYALMIRKLYEQLARSYNNMVDVVNTPPVSSSAFNSITSGTNTTAAMVVGTGATLTPLGTGEIESTDLATTGASVNVSASAPPTHAGEILISQPGNTTAVWSDPLVQGIQAAGTTGTTVNPVLVAGVDGSGNLKNPVLDAFGDWQIRPGSPKTANWSSAAITFSALGANVIIAAVAAQTVRVMRMFIVNADAALTTQITIQDTTPTSFTGAFPLIPNGSFSARGEGEPHFISGSGKGIQINSSVAVQISGTVWYTQSA